MCPIGQNMRGRGGCFRRRGGRAFECTGLENHLKPQRAEASVSEYNHLTLAAPPASYAQPWPVIPRWKHKWKHVSDRCTLRCGEKSQGPPHVEWAYRRVQKPRARVFHWTVAFGELPPPNVKGTCEAIRAIPGAMVIEESLEEIDPSLVDAKGFYKPK